VKRRAEARHTELEETVQRQLVFVDRLLKDKAELAAQCEQLADEMQAIGKKHVAKLTEVEEEGAREVKRQKEVWAATEKAKREKWQAEKSKEIKVLTLKGLEPEVQRMIEKQKLELKKMEERMAEEMRMQARLSPSAQAPRSIARSPAAWRARMPLAVLAARPACRASPARSRGAQGAADTRARMRDRARARGRGATAERSQRAL
jgi:hypothetical protein